MNRVLQAGIPLWRVYIGLQLVHPQMAAMGYMWRRGEHVQAIARAYGIQFTPAYIGSPMQEAREQGRAVRYRMKDVGEDHHATLREHEGGRRHRLFRHADAHPPRRAGARRHLRHRQPRAASPTRTSPTSRAWST